MARRKRHWFRILFLLVAVYAVIGFFAVPAIIRPQLEKRLAVELGRKVTVGRVQFNPLALSATVEGVDVRTANGTGSLVSWTRLNVNFDSWASLKGEWVLSDLRIDGLQAAVEIAPDGTPSFADIVEQVERSHPRRPPKPGERSWRIGRLNVVQARVSFVDRSRGEIFNTQLGPANFTVLNFRTGGGQGAPSRFDATTESGERITWLGTLTTKPLASSGEVRIENLVLPKYAPYLEQRLEALVASGQVDLSARYEFGVGFDERLLRISDARVQVKQLRLNERKGGDPILDLQVLEVAGISADLFNPKLSIKSAHLTGGRVGVRRDSDGSINLFSLVRQPSGGSSAAPAISAPPHVRTQKITGDLVVQEFVGRDLAVTFDDFTGTRPVHLELSGVSASAKNISLRDPTPAPVELAFKWRPQGTVHVAGTVVVNPLHAELDLDLAAVALSPLSTYLEQQYAVRLVRGATRIKGHVSLTRTEDQPMELSFSGEAGAEDFALNSSATGEELAGFTALRLADVRFAQGARSSISLGEIRLTNPFVRATIDSNKQLNLAHLRLRPARVAALEVQPPPASDAAGADVSIANAAIENGNFSLVDQSTKPVAKFGLQMLEGGFRNLSGHKPEGGEVDLKATINGGQPVALTGRMNPFQKIPFAFLTLDARAVDLLPFSAYAGKYAGFELERGKLSLENQTKLLNDRLEMQNTLRLDDLTLGHPTGSPDAVKLPVRLGVALLKDADGRIVLQVPVQGSLQDPQFRVANVAGQVISQAITKAAASPFTLIGAMFGGGGDELAEQEFLPGETTVTPDSLRKLATIQRAMVARPELNLELEGGYDLAADTYRLKRHRIEDRVIRRVQEERARRASGPAADASPVTPTERGAMIRRIFDDTFPVLTRFSKPLPAAPPPEPPPIQPPQPPAHRGVVRRAIDVATFKGLRDRHASDNAQEEAREPVSVERKPLITETEIPLDEMVARLAETISITPDDLHELADARAMRLKQIITSDGKISADRISIATSGDATAAARGPRVALQFR